MACSGCKASHHHKVKLNEPGGLTFSQLDCKNLPYVWECVSVSIYYDTSVCFGCAPS